MTKYTRRIIYVLILCGAFALAINSFVVKSTADYIKVPQVTGTDALRADALTEGADCIMVLGAGIYNDRTPTPMLRDRLERGIELYKAGYAPKLLMTGDNGQVEYNEVEAMKEYAIDKGVPEEDIFLDHAGFSTYDSVYRARDVFEAGKIIIVTQKYHVHRALYVAAKLGVDAEGVSSDGSTYIGQEMRDFREILARDKDFFKCIFKPKPKYLGDVIDLHGDGRKTW